MNKHKDIHFQNMNLARSCESQNVAESHPRGNIHFLHERIVKSFTNGQDETEGKLETTVISVERIS